MVKKLTGYILALALILVLPQVGMSKDIKKLKPGKMDSKMFVLNGDNAWLNTGFMLKETDKVVIKASGKVFFSTGESYSETSPAGYPRQAFESDFLREDAAHCIDPIEEANHAALIGKDSQGMFVIGKNKALTKKKGPLFIGINDCSFKGKFYNTGKFMVNIKVVRGK